MVVMPKRASKTPAEDEYTTIKIPNDLVNLMDHLIGRHGFKSRGEIVKEALRALLNHYCITDGQFAIINHSATGVKVQDRKLGRVADIQFTPSGIYCPVCDAHNCEHIRYALEQDDIKQIVLQKQKEGWKLPDP
jgi:hypothetical protein